MKRIIALLTVFAFVAVLAGMVYAQADTRSAAEKLAAGRAYLKLLDQKIIRLRKQGKTATVKKMQAEKKSTIANMQTWKAQAEAEMAAPPPPPPPRPVAPTPPPPPRPVSRPAPASMGLLGMGINTGYSVGYLMGKSGVTVRGDIVLNDAMGIGPMLGMSEDSIKWKIGMAAVMGKDVNENEKKALPLLVDGVMSLPADMLGVESYLGGGLNYVVYGSEKKSGSYGGQVYFGVQGDVGLGGNSFAEVGYAIVRSGADAGHVTPYSFRGVTVNVGTQILM